MSIMEPAIHDARMQEREGQGRMQITVDKGYVVSHMWTSTTSIMTKFVQKSDCGFPGQNYFFSRLFKAFCEQDITKLAYKC